MIHPPRVEALDHGRTRRAGVVLVALFLGSLVIGPLPTLAQTPLEWKIDTFRSGDTSTYTVSSGSPMISFGVRDAATTRDGFGRTVDVVLGTSTQSSLTTTVAIDASTGGQVWRQLPADDVGAATRSFAAFGSPWLYGASVLAGRTLQPGLEVNLPLWDGLRSHEATFDVGAPLSEDGDLLLPVFVSLSDGAGPSAIGDWAPRDGSVLYFDESSPFPKRVERYGAVALQRTSMSRGTEPAWSTAEVPDSPWVRNPLFRFVEPPDANGPPPEDAEGLSYWDPTLRAAVGFAETHAPGLEAFKESHPGTVFVQGYATARSFNRLGALGVLAVEQRETGWTLLYQGNGDPEGWAVDVVLTRAFVTGVEMTRDMRVEDERAALGFGSDAVPMTGAHAELSGVAGRFPARIGDYEFDHMWIMRVNALHAWSQQVRFAYRAEYKDATLPCGSFICVTTFYDIQIHSDTGAVYEIRGPPRLLTEYDANGLGWT